MRSHIKISLLNIMILINISTIFYVDLYQENLTYLGNQNSDSFLYYLWGISTSIIFYMYTRAIINNMKSIPKYLHLFLKCSLFFLLTALFIPYDPQKSSIVSQLHITSSMLSVLLFLFIHSSCLNYLFKQEILIYQKLAHYFYSILFFEAFLIIIFSSITALTEISFVICMSLWLYYVDQVLNQNNL